MDIQIINNGKPGTWGKVISKSMDSGGARSFVEGDEINLIAVPRKNWYREEEIRATHSICVLEIGGMLYLRQVQIINTKRIFCIAYRGDLGDFYISPKNVSKIYVVEDCPNTRQKNPDFGMNDFIADASAHFSGAFKTRVPDDSLDNGCVHAFKPNEAIRCARLPRPKWGEMTKNKPCVLRIGNVCYLRQITSIEGNKIKCHSWNVGHFDFTIEAHRVTDIYLIEKINQPSN